MVADGVVGPEWSAGAGARPGWRPPVPPKRVGHWGIEPPDTPPSGRGPHPGSPAWWFTNRVTGRITVAQFPNVSLMVFVGAAVAGRLLDHHHQISRILADVATGAIVLWALDEIVRGVNPWRRVLGAVVLAVSIRSLVLR